MTETRSSFSTSHEPDSSKGAAAPRSEAFGLLLDREIDTHREANRVTAALVALLVLAAVVVNAGIYHGVRSRLVKERWEQLASYADDKRSDVRETLRQLRQKARYVTEQAGFREWVERAMTGAAAHGGRSDAQRELDRAAQAFGFHAIHVVTTDGKALAGTAAFGESVSPREVELSMQAVADGRPVTAVSRVPGQGAPGLALSVPVVPAGSDGRGASAIFYADPGQALQRVLSGSPALGARATAFLVGRVEDATVILSSPPPGAEISVGERVPESDRERVEVAAARGVESSIEVRDRNRGPTWTVTRSLPELGVGLVGQIDRATALEEMHETVSGLLILDLGVLLLGGSAIWLWRRRYEAALTGRELLLARRQAERIRAIFDNAFDAILTFDVHGRVHTANRAAQSLFKHSAAQMEGEPVHRFLRYNVAGNGGDIDSLPLETVFCSEGLRADGEVIPVEVSLACAGEGEHRTFTAVARDISDRVEAEDRIRAFARGLETTNRRLEEANAQLEEASRLKSEFLANTSHELRTPLNGMIGFLQLVLDGMCDSPEEEREFLEQALQCSRHLLGLINDVLDIAKIEAGKLALEIEAVDVQKLFGEIYTLTHVQAAQKGIDLKFETPEACRHRVRGDFGKVKQVLVNLVGNSLKFTSKGNVVVRATECADLGHYRFEVEDTGIGIPPDRQKLIFEKFTQGDGSTTRKYGGTGLGLAISRSLVEMMGGIISVHSEGAGRGTRVCFSLPLWRADEEETDAVEPHELERIDGPSGGPLILMVEDDAVFRRFQAALLHRHGYRTVEATNAEAGWVLARRLRPAAIVLDYALSCSDSANLRTGWDLAERLTTDSRTRSIPLIFVTGFDLQLRDKLKATVFARPPEHLMKPVESSVLLAKIDEVVGPAHGGVVRILMADDDPSVSAYVRKVLPQDRFHIEVANNGEECLHILRMQPHGFDLLLLDLMMPDVSGYDVLRELTLTGSELPVMILTNFPEARDEEERRLLEKGLVLDVVSKSSVHDNPVLLPHTIDWHLQVATELERGNGSAPGAAPAATERKEAA